MVSGLSQAINIINIGSVPCYALQDKRKFSHHPWSGYSSHRHFYDEQVREVLRLDKQYKPLIYNVTRWGQIEIIMAGLGGIDKPINKD